MGQLDTLTRPLCLKRCLSLLKVLLLLQVLPTTQTQLVADYLEMEEYRPNPKLERGPPGTVYFNGTYLYQPSPPGKRPPCARKGETFCTDIPAYPKDVLKKLLTNWSFDLSSLFVSETDDRLSPGNDQIITPPPPTQSPTRPTYLRPGRPILRQSAGRNTTYARRPPIGARIPGSPANRNTARPGSTNRGATGGFPGYTYLPPPKSFSWGSPFSAAHRRRRQAGNDDTATKLCPTAGQFITPKAGLNSRGQWRFLVNERDSTGKYTQLVRTERCLTEECSGLCTIPAGTRARCKQQYVQKKMICLDPGGTRMYTDLFWLPSCCVCEIS